MAYINGKQILFSPKIIYKDTTEYDTFWDNYQDYGNRRHYNNAFYNVGWNEANFKPKYDIIAEMAHALFSYSGITSIDVVVDLSNASNAANLCTGATKLKSIKEIICNETNDFEKAFFYCSSLEEVRFSGSIGMNTNLSFSPLLSKESIISVINTLSPTVEGKYLYLSYNAIIAAFGNINATEWRQLEYSKKYWTILLL